MHTVTLCRFSKRRRVQFWGGWSQKTFMCARQAETERFPSVHTLGRELWRGPELSHVFRALPWALGGGIGVRKEVTKGQQFIVLARVDLEEVSCFQDWGDYQDRVTSAPWGCPVRIRCPGYPLWHSRKVKDMTYLCYPSLRRWDKLYKDSWQGKQVTPNKGDK